MLSALKARIYPSISQIDDMSINLQATRYIWNHLLAMSIDRYHNNPDLPLLSAFDMNYLITQLKREFPWLKNAESSSLQQVATDLSDAYQRFFNHQNKFPRFKSWRYPRQSYTIKNNHNIDITQNYIHLPKLGWMACHLPKSFQGVIKRVTIKRSATHKYYALILVEADVKPYQKTHRQVGVDLGLTSLATLSTGDKVAAIRFDKRLAKRKRVWERKLARRRRLAEIEISQAKHYHQQDLTLDDFNNLQKAKQMVAKYHEKIANQRLDYCHQLTHRLVKQFDTIVVEDIKSKFMLKNHHLARAASNISWGMLITQLVYKAQWYDKTVIKVNPAKTSQICHHCGHDDGKHGLSIRRWVCPNCQTELDRDINASKNILSKGLALIK